MAHRQPEPLDVEEISDIASGAMLDEARAGYSSVPRCDDPDDYCGDVDNALYEAGESALRAAGVEITAEVISLIIDVKAEVGAMASCAMMVAMDGGGIEEHEIASSFWGESNAPRKATASRDSKMRTRPMMGPRRCGVRSRSSHGLRRGHRRRARSSARAGPSDEPGGDGDHAAARSLAHLHVVADRPLAGVVA